MRDAASGLLLVIAVLAVVGLPRPGQAATRAQAVASGSTHTCTLTRTGGVKCWGGNSSGQLGDGTGTSHLTAADVTGLTSGVAAVAAGEYHTCAMASGGAICWGNNEYGQLGDGTTVSRTTPTDVPGLTSGIVAVIAGYNHTCALMASGGVKCWGLNNYGQLGDGTTVNRWTPTDVLGMTSGAVAVACGTYHSCAVTTAGGVKCWGDNASGQLGDGTTTDRTTPADVPFLASGVTAVAAGGHHTCALSVAGGVKCWGDNASGQLGDGTTDDRTTPADVPGLASDVAAVSTGGYHTCVVTTSGQAKCWGDNSNGQLGDGTTAHRTTPTDVAGLSGGVATLSTGDGHTCAVTVGGGLRCWGNNRSGQIGDGTTSDHASPANVPSLTSGVAAVAAGAYHSCALTADGGATCWGGNAYGQLGDGTTVSRASPSDVWGLTAGLVAVSAGYNHTCALTIEGGVTCWGANAYGELGDATTVSRAWPAEVQGLGSGAAAVAAGMYHTCAVTTDGAARCWGANWSGQLGDGTTANRTTPTAVQGLESGVVSVTAGMYHTCVLTSGGGVKCWGYNAYGQLGDGTSTARTAPADVAGLTSGAVAVSAGLFHTCAVTTAGGVKCWGDNVYGQLGDGTRTARRTPADVTGLANGIAAAVAGMSHTCAVAASGRLKCWGDNAYGQLGDGTTTSRTTPAEVTGVEGGVTEAVTGYRHTCARTVGGGVACWGDNFFGQLGDPTIGPRLTPARVVGVGVATTSDVTGDGRSDVVWRHATGGDVWVWTMEGAAATAQSHIATVADTGWEIVGLGDQTDDGRSELLWRHQSSGQLHLWTVNGMTLMAVTPVAVVDTMRDIVGTGDYNGDGRSDILWRHVTTGTLWIWLMNGATVISSTVVESVPIDYEVMWSADLNGDGRSDLVWRNRISGDVWAWLMNGTTVSTSTYLGSVVDLNYRIADVADVDGDGNADLLWWHAMHGDVWAWRMNGSVIMSVSQVATVPDVDYQIVGTGDYDGDGISDVLWHHATRGEVWVWLMGGASPRSATMVGTVPDVRYRVVHTR